MNAMQQLVARAIERGLIKARAPMPDVVLFRGNNKRANERNRRPKFNPIQHAREKRQQHIADGLSWLGKPRKVKTRPELRAFTGRAYRREYMRVWRREREQ